MLVHYTYGHMGEKLKLKLRCWVLALSDVRVWVSPSTFPSHIYCVCRPPCWAKQPHNQIQIIGAKGSWVGALVIYKHVGTYNTCTHIHTHWPLGLPTYTLTRTHHQVVAIRTAAMWLSYLGLTLSPVLHCYLSMCNLRCQGIALTVAAVFNGN